MGQFAEKLAALPDKHIAHELWRRGDVSYMLFPHGQTRIYNFIRQWEESNPNSYGPVVVEAHRGLGKSFLLLAYALERCFRWPYQQVGYLGPVFKQVLELCAHNLGKLLVRAPDLDMEVRTDKITVRNAKWKTDDPRAKSILFFGGTNREVIENQRGLRRNLLVIDELRDVDNPDYVITDVLGFTFVMQERPLMILSSTPPSSPAHEWCSRYVPEALSEGRYICQNVDDNEDFREEDREKLVKLCGGTHTTAWKREAMCEHVPDESCMVVPEYMAARAELLKVWEKPSHCYHFVCFDSGFKDATAVLFGYLDFMKAKLVIEDEIVVHYKPTSEVAALIKAKIKALGWAKLPLFHQTRFVADATPQQLADLQHDHQLCFSEAEKHDKWASLASLRAAIQEQRIVLSPKCRNLDHQLKTGIFNKTRKDFERTLDKPIGDSPISGHLDAIAALMYLWRLAKDTLAANPYPTKTLDSSDMWINDQPRRRPNLVITRDPLIVSRRSL